MAKDLTQKELDSLYEMAEKLAPTHPDYKPTTEAIERLEKIKLEKEKLRLQEEENAQKMVADHEYNMRKLDIESDYKSRELDQQKEQANSQKKLKFWEIGVNAVVMVGVGVMMCFAEETRMISKNLFGLFQKASKH